jgi:hypothetical protein
VSGEDQPPPYEATSKPPPASDETASVQVHPLPSRDALLVKIQPPTAPARQIHHVPCDIVLVIDVSGSMGIRADVPGEEPDESPGLSVLDLTKHAALTIIETLDDGDRLGIVTFGSKSTVVQRLIPMTRTNKAVAQKNIKNIKKQDATNLWHGILDGIKLFRQGDNNAGSSSPLQRVPALMVLTDGKPNFMCPPQGYVPKLRTIMPLPASIHTFGFGYNLDSGLLKSIAEVGGGNYAFIPDAGLIGTVFVHAVANLQSTFATNAELDISCPLGVKLEECMGEYVGKEISHAGARSDVAQRMRIKLGNLQYGQSRDVFLKMSTSLAHGKSAKESPPLVHAEVFYQRPSSLTMTTDPHPAAQVPVAGYGNILEETGLPPTEAAYHESRARTCQFLSSLFPMSSTEVHEPIKLCHLQDKRDELTLLINNLPAQRYKDSDARNRSLVEDLAGLDPKGQISLAVGNTAYFSRWGTHYLLSLLNAHTRQVCNSFKDPGPLQYGVDSPLFVECRDRLDSAFDNLPAPEPSLPPRTRIVSFGGHASNHSSGPFSGHHQTRFSMSRYHNPMGICFAGSTPVELAPSPSHLAGSRKRTIPIRMLRRGMMVRTPLGARRVAAVLKTRVEGETLCRVPGGVLVTPWHPISGGGGGGAANKQWVFPAQVAVGTVRYAGCVYSVMLQRDGDERAHALRVGQIWGVTLGHGLTSEGGNNDDVRVHEFFGDYDKVAAALVKLGVSGNGVAVGRGVVRDSESGLVVGFRNE